jgi:alkylhydroperoxidase family enzyme
MIAAPGWSLRVQQLPRLDFDALTPELRELLAPRVKRLGYLGEFFQAAAHQPEALGHFVRFTEALREALPPRVTQLVALSVAAWAENHYERVQHERLALKLGLHADWIRDVLRLAPDQAVRLDAEERAAQAFVLDVVARCGRDSGDTGRRYLALAGPERFVAVLLATGRYLAHAAFCNAVGVRAPVASPLEVGS